ncbi:ATP-binding protein [Streptomyces sp. LP11]|uniref:ATP-binding protein n=1 Tax=Streptomyces pyxinicus TaxID=2970331 RepID=A0ABT2BCT7_9ACTN|nr:ATP-binding protein [Streptomyces sp. LP11]MCS0606343.1 ATP-binding protein [Streptomyces sp. LP11]
MDPNTPGPDEHGQALSRRPPREPLAADFAANAPAVVRTARVVTGDLLLTVNPVDGSEIEPCPPAERPARPGRLTAAERAEAERAARPPVPPGPARADHSLPTPDHSPPARDQPLPARDHSLLERQDERERLVRLLARGRTVRLTGPGGSGRTALLDLVAEDCRDLAPDGVVRLSGYHRTADEVLSDLCHAVYDAPGYRPDTAELHALVGEIGAVVVLDDLEFGGAALDALLDATPECAFLLAATPDVPAPSADSDVEEVYLGGLDRAAGVEILERTVGRVLTEEEANWAGDLWFESEGLPLRFVQAGALLRQRDQLRASTGAVDEYGVFEDVRPSDVPPDLADGPGEDVPLPSLGEAAAPAPLLASRLSGSARAALRFAVALGGEVPHQAHLPALVGDTHADAALGELAACGLVSPVGARYRLAAGVPAQLEAAGYADDAPDRALAAARHYAWWAGHPSVTPARVCQEADAVLAALAAVVPRAVPPAEGEETPAVRLARTAAPAFAAGLHWTAWERALRSGAEASRASGEVAEQAFFQHELGVLALCGGQLDRARAELEASIGLRAALADKRGAVAGRRALALVADRSGDVPPVPAVAAWTVPEVPDTRPEELPRVPYGLAGDTLVTRQPTADGAAGKPVGGFRRLARRNLVAAGSGALLAVVLGTVVTLGMTSNENAGKDPAGTVDVDPSATQDVDDGGLGADPGAPGGDTATTGTGTGSGAGAGTAVARPTAPGPDGTYGTTDDPVPPVTAGPSSHPGGTSRPGSTSPSPSKSSPSKPSSPHPTKTGPTDPPSETPTTPSTPPSGSGSPTGSTGPSTTNTTNMTDTAKTASGPVASSTSAASPDGADRVM